MILPCSVSSGKYFSFWLSLAAMMMGSTANWFSMSAVWMPEQP